MDDSPSIAQRKIDHLELCATGQVEFRRKTTLLEEVELIHDSLPELSLDEIDLSSSVLGRELNAPFLITGMTGGAERAGEINRLLATLAQEFGFALGLGSQRAMLRDPSLAATYAVRGLAPDVLLLGNIGAVQAAELERAEALDLVEMIGADALCIHLNPGQELFQPEGDRDFRGCLDGIARLSDELPVPVIVKETGCGLSARTLKKIASTSVRWVDTSGAGGTTWIGVETLRSTVEDPNQAFWDWGIPTAASVIFAKEAGFSTIASGGMRTGLDAARAIALGADLVGMALPWLRAAMESESALRGQAVRLTQDLTRACLMTGSRDLDALRTAPKILGPRLERWCYSASRISR